MEEYSQLTGSINFWQMAEERLKRAEKRRGAAALKVGPKPEWQKEGMGGKYGSRKQRSP